MRVEEFKHHSFHLIPSNIQTTIQYEALRGWIRRDLSAVYMSRKAPHYNITLVLSL